MNLTIISFILRSHLQRQTKCQIQTQVKNKRKNLRIAKLFQERKMYL